MLGSLLKAAAGLAIETPLSLVKDAATLGGAITGEQQPATLTALQRVVENVSDATAPEKR